MLLPVLAVLAGFALLIVGGEGTVRGAASVAARLRIAPFVIGATVVAFSTSVPELVVTVTAGLKGQPSLALSNVVGSNIANLALILGVAALVGALTLPRLTLKFEAPMALVVMILMIGVGWDRSVGRFEGILLLVFTVIMVLRVLQGLRGPSRTLVETEIPELPLLPSLLLLTGGLGAMIGGGQLLVNGAIQIATLLGVSSWVIGIAIVSVGTSLPEIAASGMAAYRGRGDLAIGNVLGSNAFNTLFVLGTGATLAPIKIEEQIHLDLVFYGFLTLFPLALLAIWSKIGRPAGLLLLIAYIGYIAVKFGLLGLF